MDKLNKYRKIISKVLIDLANYGSSSGQIDDLFVMNRPTTTSYSMLVGIRVVAVNKVIQSTFASKTAKFGLNGTAQTKKSCNN